MGQIHCLSDSQTKRIYGSKRRRCYKAEETSCVIGRAPRLSGLQPGGPGGKRERVGVPQHRGLIFVSANTGMSETHAKHARMHSTHARCGV
ncbi:hypothetical protein COCON_G00214360 [Conger conger]|uniref:Uncharacterized protein n=1 Tax=Conger conger TaxID=82655 RepID=A0A9Q1HNF3_CONCO|nr:hypothetical protein COCON_G00214360 [Conger conger]